MDISTDEVRRELRDSQTEHQAMLRPFRELLLRTFDRDTAATEAAKRQVLGLPGRRQFLRVGGVTVAMSAVLAACGSDSQDSNVPESGDRPTTSTTAGNTSTTVGSDAEAVDLTLLRTASSLEVLAVAAYQAALDSGNLTTPAIKSAAELFQSQHEDHANLLETTTEDLGGTPYTDPNPVLLEALQETIDAIPDADELVIVQAAADLENMAAQTYAYAGGVLSTPELRGAIMSIGTTEARHLTLLKSVLEQEPVEFPFMPLRDRVPEDALLPEGDGED